MLQNLYYAKAPPLPLQTFVHGSVAFNLSRDPTLTHKLSIAEAAKKFNIPDLNHAVLEYLVHLKDNGSVPWHIGGHCLST